MSYQAMSPGEELHVILLDSINQLSMEEIALARGLVPSTTTNLRYFGLLCTMATSQPT